MIVIADTTPLNYLILIEQTEALQALYGEVIIPPAVRNELHNESAPAPVRRWIADPPEWLQTQPPNFALESASEKLGPGEREAIALALELKTDLLIADDLAAREEAARRSILVIGTLGVLKQAAEAGLLDLKDTIESLRKTSFYVSPALLERLLRSAD